MIFGMSKKNKELDVFADLLAKGVVSMFREKGDIKFSKKPELVQKNIIEYEGRMRAEGMEKFNDPTFVAAVNYYSNQKDMEAHKALGTVIVYVEQVYIATIMRLLKYPKIDDENEDAMKDSCGALCNIVGGRFKSEIASKGYVAPEMSHFTADRNKIINGVEFCYDEFDMYEVSFYIENVKRLVIEMTIGAVPKK